MLKSLARCFALGALAIGWFGTTVAADDLAGLQGKWEMTIQQNGAAHRVVKTIEGQTETVEVFSAEMLVQKHIVEFSLEKFGPAKIFQWRKGKIVAGPHAGKDLPDGRFIYRLDDTTWTCVHGMLEGDQTGILREVYRRVTPVPAARGT